VTAEEPSPRVAGYVLGGGGSTRFGHDKALTKIDSKPMLMRMCDLLGQVAGDVRVVAGPGKYASLGLSELADRWPGEGPLGGIITALLASADSGEGRDWNLIVGCDMPFLTREWLAYLVQRALASSSEVLVPKSTQGLEPLCACWRTNAAGKLRRAFGDGVRKVTEGMEHLQMEILDQADWKRFDNAGRLFWNMNTPADYDEAKRLLEANKG
jgi:molybdenum cofactor guanylyltransferase